MTIAHRNERMGIVVAAYPFRPSMFEAGIPAKDVTERIRVLDVAEFVARAVDRAPLNWKEPYVAGGQEPECAGWDSVSEG